MAALRPRHLLATACLALAVTALVVLGRLASPAEARVTPRVGFRATVLGWTSWYGSYDLGALGPAWCIDHGLTAPDPAFAYLPTSLPDVDADTAAALSWAVSVHGVGNDPVEAAAVMLAVHDLRHASYPSGRLDVDVLTPHQLAGFGGQEAAVIDRARAIKADALAHARFRGPFHLTATIERPEADHPNLVATLTDAAGTPVPGAGVHIDAIDAEVDQPDPPSTRADGSVAVAFRLSAPPAGATFTIHVIVPDPVPAAFAASTVRAQRVVRSSWIGLSTTLAWAPPISTPPTTPAPTTTTRPPVSTTTTRPRPTTTTTRPPATTSTTTPPTTQATTPSTTAPTAPTAPGPSTTALPPAVGATLPRTGRAVGGSVALGVGLIASGVVLVGVSRRRWSDAGGSRR